MHSPKVELSGVLSRCIFGDDQAEIRLTPFAMSKDEAPVWSLLVLEPSFEGDAVQPYLNNEVEVEVLDKRAIVYDVWRETELVLGGSGLRVSQVPYDTDDLRLHVETLEAHVENLHSDLQNARTKDTEGRAILRELVRRAEIKAGASDHHRDRQAAAIEVLRRLQVHFGD